MSRVGTYLRWNELGTKESSLSGFPFASNAVYTHRYVQSGECDCGFTDLYASEPENPE